MNQFKTDGTMEKIIQIAIDGPAGAGKSTIAKKIAEKLNILYLDTGAMYRAVTLHALKNEIEGSNNDALAKLFEHFDLRFIEDRLFLNGEDITDQIRTPKIEKAISAFAANPLVREHLVKMQREIGNKQSIVMEGRDIGTVVLRDTPLKFYLDANVDVRADRRYAQNLQKGIESDREMIKNEIIRRDTVDSGREADPLMIAPGCTVIDTSGMNMDEVITAILNKILIEE